MILASRFDAQQNEKDQWLRARLDALNFYRGRTREYITPYFSRDTLAKVPVSNINIVKRIIDRISLCYMVDPARDVSYDGYADLTLSKGFRMQKLERYVNLLEVVLIKPCLRGGVLDYDIVTDFEPAFGDDPMKPTSIEYPLATRSSVRDETPEIWAYWSESEHFLYDKNNSNKRVYNSENPKNINPYGVLPFTAVFRDGMPETHYLDTDACSDMIQSNLFLNLVDTSRTANILFQSFG